MHLVICCCSTDSTALVQFVAFVHPMFFFFPTRKATFPALKMVQDVVPRACWAQLIDKEEVGMSEPAAKDVIKKEAEG